MCPCLRDGVPLGHKDNGTCCLGGAASIADREGQQRTALARRHGQSISGKQGKLIPGPSALLMGVNTILQLEAGAATLSLWGWPLWEGAQHSTGSSRGTGRTWLPKEREVGAKAGELPEFGRQGQQPCSHGVSRALRQHSRPWLERLTGTSSNWAACRGNGKKRDADKQFHREAFPSFNPLATTQQKSNHGGSCCAGCPCRMHPLHCRAGHAPCPQAVAMGTGMPVCSYCFNHSP